MHYAVVVRADGGPSQATSGSFACFEGDTPHEAINAALLAKTKWEKNGNGPYDVVLTEVVGVVRLPKPRIQYKLMTVRKKRVRRGRKKRSRQG